MKQIINSPEEMMNLGQELAAKGHTHVLLSGQLGAGKTHFAKGFARGLGLDPERVTSPTYTYLDSHGVSSLLHCDFYRLEVKQELWSKGIIDSIQDHNAVLIERPKREQEYADEDWLVVSISVVDEKTREVEIVNYSLTSNT